MNYHFLYNEENGPVQECYIEAESFYLAEGFDLAAMEKRFIQQHPEAVYWEIGIPD